jgi:hypothetical protein
VEYRRRYSEIGCIVPVCPASALQVPAGNQPTGPDPELKVEGMPGKTIFHSHSRKGALTCFPTFRFSPNDILHGLKLAQIPCASTAWGQASINSGVAVQVAYIQHPSTCIIFPNSCTDIFGG